MVPLHAGLGGAKDLPIPAELAIAGGIAALIVSFCVLVLAWRKPRYADPDHPRNNGRPVPESLARIIDSDGYRWALRLAGLAITGYFTWALVAGPDLRTNPVFGVFYVLLWVGLVPASLLFGRIYYALSPVRTLFRLISVATRTDTRAGVFTYPERLGYWPAAAGLFAFVWQELVNPESAWLAPVRLWIGLYVGIMIIGAALFGEVWLSRADPFEVYSNLLAKLSPWGRDQKGRLVWRSPLANLSTLVPRPGLVATVAVLFGSTAFDSFKDSNTWARFLNRHIEHAETINTAGLFAFCAIVGITFGVAIMSTGVDPTSRYAATRRVLPQLFAHSVVPIVVGYMTAHYVNYLFEQGQQTLIYLSDPMGNGSNLLGTANWPVNYWLSFHPTTLATTKVIAVVLGHILGVVAAHDRALTLLPKRHHVTGQLGLLVIMVAYTGTGLYLLFGS